MLHHKQRMVQANIWKSADAKGFPVKVWFSCVFSLIDAGSDIRTCIWSASRSYCYQTIQWWHAWLVREKDATTTHTTNECNRNTNHDHEYAAYTRVDTWVIQGWVYKSLPSMPNNSTLKINTAFGPISPPAPRAPYAKSVIRHHHLFSNTIQ